MYSRSVRATSPSDQPAYRPKFKTVPDGRPGGGPAAPKPSAECIDSSYPLPCVERPEVQSRDTVSGWGRTLTTTSRWSTPPSWRPRGRPRPPSAADRAARRPARLGPLRISPARRGAGVVLSTARFRSNAWRFAGSPMSSHAALIAAIRFAASEVVARSGMVFAGEPSIGGLDHLVLGLGVDLQDLVGVDVRHRPCHRSGPSRSSAGMPPGLPARRGRDAGRGSERRRGKRRSSAAQGSPRAVPPARHR